MLSPLQVDNQASSPAWVESISGQQTPIRGTCFFGRANGSTLKLEGDRVSRRHAMLHAQGNDEFWLVDLGSSNGTYVNGRRVSQPCRLADKDQISIADHTFTFRQPQANSAAGEEQTKTEKTIQEIKSLTCWLLVADIESSTQFTQRLPADEAPRITGRWLAECKQIIDDHGGSINKFLGDGFFAYWPDRPETPDQVAKALGVLRQQQDKEHPRFRVVLHYGKVFAGGAASLGEESLLGSEVNFIFRMEKMAGSINALRLMSEPAHERIKAIVSAEPGTRHALASFEGEFLFFRF